MIITSHMQKIIQIYPCLLKLSCKQESVTDGQTDRRTDWQTAAITISPHSYRGGIIMDILFIPDLKSKIISFYAFFTY